jgi:hypothetical protein
VLQPRASPANRITLSPVKAEGLVAVNKEAVLVFFDDDGENPIARMPHTTQYSTVLHIANTGRAG